MDKKDELCMNTKRLIEDGLLTGKDIVLFGCNRSSEQIEEILEQAGLHAAAVIDNNDQKCGTAPFGIMTYLAEEYLREYHGDAVFLIASQYAMEMAAQLEPYGYELDRHIFIVQSMIGRNSIYNTSDEAFEYQSKKIEWGGALYTKLYEKYAGILSGENSRLLIFPAPSMGDIFMPGGFVKSWLEQESIEEYVVIVVSQTCRQVAELFGWQPVEVLTYLESAALIDWLRFCGEDEKAVIMYAGFEKTSKNSYVKRMQGYKGLNFSKWFSLAVFQLPGNVKWENNVIRCQDADCEVEEYAASLHMKRGKAVILAPWRHGKMETYNELFAHIAEICLSMGYQVYINGESDLGMKAAVCIMPPIRIVREVIEYAGTFIGIRNGLCDVGADVRAKKIIIYDRDYNFFSLNKMGLCQDAIEIIINNQNQEEIIEEVKSQLYE